jgi:hypothetical protein
MVLIETTKPAGSRLFWDACRHVSYYYHLKGFCKLKPVRIENPWWCLYSSQLPPSPAWIAQDDLYIYINRFSVKTTDDGCRRLIIVSWFFFVLDRGILESWMLQHMAALLLLFWSHAPRSCRSRRTLVLDLHPVEWIGSTLFPLSIS